MERLKLTLIILSVLLIVACGYILTETVDFCETAKNESYAAGFKVGEEEGFNKGYFNGSRDYLIALNQNKVFPCLDFQTGEYNQKPIGGLCQNE